MAGKAATRKSIGERRARWSSCRKSAWKPPFRTRWSRGGVKTLRETANTGKAGDGKIFVVDVADAVRIRTGGHGKSAL